MRKMTKKEIIIGNGISSFGLKILSVHSSQQVSDGNNLTPYKRGQESYTYLFSKFPLAILINSWTILPPSFPPVFPAS